MAYARLALALNLSNGAVGQYQGYDFNSFARIGNTYFAANEEGLYTLDDSDTDNGARINAHLTSKKLNFGEIYEKWAHHAYLSYRAAGDMELVITPEGMDPQDYSFENDEEAASWHTDLIPVDRQASNYFTYRVGNVAGCDCTVKSLFLLGPKRKPLLVFSGVTGLNNRVDPAFIKHDHETGVQDMAEIINFYVDDALRAHRRKGFTLRAAGRFHSLYSDGNTVYVAKDRETDAAIYSVSLSGYSLKGIRSGLTRSARVSFQDYGTRLFYANGHENGLIQDGESSPWVGADPPQDDPQAYMSRIISRPPVIGEQLARFGPYMILAHGPDIYWSVAGAPFWFRPFEDRRTFESDITMIMPLDDGVWMSDNRHVYWLDGRDPAKWERTVKSNYPAIAGTATTVEASRVLDGSMTGRVAVFATTQGLCVGGKSGGVHAASENVTDKKLVYPTSQHGAAVFINRTDIGMPALYIATLEP